MNRTVKYQGAFSRNVGFADKSFLFPPPPPPSTRFFCSRSNFRAITRLETLATHDTFLRIMWVFGHFFMHVPAHMITVGDFQGSNVNGDGKKHRSVPEVFHAASAYGRGCVGPRPTPKIPTAREKNLWYPG